MRIKVNCEVEITPVVMMVVMTIVKIALGL